MFQKGTLLHCQCEISKSCKTYFKKYVCARSSKTVRTGQDKRIDYEYPSLSPNADTRTNLN